ncbi:hypothetical protein [Actinomadura madurae]|uniref:hypothetical protein n=1 Tax=Actinomadura madurae TaxID=1993 RepID=UPI0020D21536|nr:hypothetical protein [Actinomadura madurae]MCP9947292.1 hypothetical protein [Actinomadura madurae]MCP9964053.1 hypothetical protein [Actinomadura madurae]MCP9976528.1 hypothetical protein [Actinomadura madurae]MCQ0011975.1 hypothetical protein [Actinomadura madurae]MCQ0012725.1 hypothetical protein [Actinomadura madurae]
MSAEDTGFDAGSGWSFRREEDGGVHIVAPDSMGPGAHQVVTLDADTWAAVVASMGAQGKPNEGSGITITVNPSPPSGLNAAEIARIAAARRGGPAGGAMRV